MTSRSTSRPSTTRKRLGQPAPPGLDDDQSLYVQPRHGGSWYDLANRGQMFQGNIAAAGVVLPLVTNTTQQVGLWNPAGNDVDAGLRSISLTYVSTTGAPGGFVFCS